MASDASAGASFASPSNASAAVPRKLTSAGCYSAQLQPRFQFHRRLSLRREENLRTGDDELMATSCPLCLPFLCATHLLTRDLRAATGTVVLRQLVRMAFGGGGGQLTHTNTPPTSNPGQKTTQDVAARCLTINHNPRTRVAVSQAQQLKPKGLEHSTILQNDASFEFQFKYCQPKKIQQNRKKKCRN